MDHQTWTPNAAGGRGIVRADVSRRAIESFRLLLAIIAQLLMLDMAPASRVALSAAVFGFSAYAVILLWLAVRDSSAGQTRFFCWLDAIWFLLILLLAGEARTQYFLFLFFPVIFAAWRTGYRESVAIAVCSGLAATGIFALDEPDVSLPRLLALPLSLLLVGPIFVRLAWGDAVVRKGLRFAANLVETLDPRRGFDAMLADALGRIAEEFGALAAVLTLQTVDGQNRIFRWAPGVGTSEVPSAEASVPRDKATSVPADLAVARARAHRWWQREHLIGVDSSELRRRPSKADCDALQALAGLPGTPPLLSVPLSRPGIGQMRITLAGPSLAAATWSLDMLLHVVEQIGPSLENACLREQLVTEAAETERARIGRDLHDSAIQPYIGLKFGLEAVQRRAGPENPVAADLARLVDTTNGELLAIREVISGLRGLPGKGETLLSNAIRRQTERLARLFGIDVELDIREDIPISRHLAGELFHIVTEGLSNIRRHTQARRAAISLGLSDESLVLEIRNEHNARSPAVTPFTPASLLQRAAALGGSVEVTNDRSCTTVKVYVPKPSSP